MAHQAQWLLFPVYHEPLTGRREQESSDSEQPARAGDARVKAWASQPEQRPCCPHGEA